MADVNKAAMVRFKSLYETSGVSSEQLIVFVDENFPRATLRHWDYHQAIWIRDHKWYRHCDMDEGVRHFETEFVIEELRRKFHTFYFNTYVAPVINDPAEYSALEDTDKNWLESWLDRLRREFPRVRPRLELLVCT